MSFLNPVNEPVKRFKSTDAGAPQINYNARTAGDVKAVIKGCLVTGYGAIAGAGWSIVNEVDHVAEFVSPSAAMSDYRLGIDDSSTSSTTWYYKYQDARTNPVGNVPTKSFAITDNTHANNGWQLLVTERGIVFIELVQHTSVNKLSSRITYYGQIKSGLANNAGENIMFFNLGHNGFLVTSLDLYNDSNKVHVRLGANNSVFFSTAAVQSLLEQNYAQGVSVIDLVASIYIVNYSKNALIGELPPLLSKLVNSPSDLFGANDVGFGERNALSVTMGYAYDNTNIVNSYARTFLIPLDYWEY